jgi:hypothetical protein
VKRSGEINRWIPPELSENLNLLFDPAASRLIVGSHRLVFDMVIADTDPEAKSPSAQKLNISRLFSHESRGPLRQNHHACRELDLFRSACQESEQNKRITKWSLLIMNTMRDRWIPT